MTLDRTLSLIAAVVTLVAAFVALRAATVEISDNQDTFIQDLARQSRWAGWAAVLNTITAGILIYQTFSK